MGVYYIIEYQFISFETIWVLEGESPKIYPKLNQKFNIKN
jgi:hypothetical protein